MMSLKRPLYEEIVDVEEFTAAYGVDDPIKALEAAEKAPSTSNYDSMPRCKHCESIKIIAKSGSKDRANERDEKFKCGECGSHMDELLPPRDPTADDDDSVGIKEAGQLLTGYDLPGGSDLREIRNILGLSLSKAEGSGFADATISSWEREKTFPTTDRLQALLTYYETVWCHQRAARLARHLEGDR